MPASSATYSATSHRQPTHRLQYISLIDLIIIDVQAICGRELPRRSVLLYRAEAALLGSSVSSDAAASLRDIVHERPSDSEVTFDVYVFKY